MVRPEWKNYQGRKAEPSLKGGPSQKLIKGLNSFLMLHGLPTTNATNMHYAADHVEKLLVNPPCLDGVGRRDRLARLMIALNEQVTGRKVRLKTRYLFEPQPDSGLYERFAPRRKL